MSRCKDLAIWYLLWPSLVPPVPCHMSYFTTMLMIPCRHSMDFVICKISHTICNLLIVTWHVSHVTCHFILSLFTSNKTSSLCGNSPANPGQFYEVCFKHSCYVIYFVVYFRSCFWARSRPVTRELLLPSLMKPSSNSRDGRQKRTRWALAFSFFKWLLVASCLFVFS